MAAATYKLISIKFPATPDCSTSIVGQSVTVNVNSIPTSVLSGGPQTTCAGTSVDLSVALTGTQPWSFTLAMEAQIHW